MPKRPADTVGEQKGENVGPPRAEEAALWKGQGHERKGAPAVVQCGLRHTLIRLGRRLGLVGLADPKRWLAAHGHGCR
jgi:hypothetical protein